MILHVEAGGRNRAVEVRRADGHFIVLLDGRELEVDVKEVAGTWSFLIGPPKGGPHDPKGGPHDSEVGVGLSRPMRSYEVAFVGGPNGAMTVHVDGVAVEVSLAAPRTWNNRAPGAVSAEAGPQRIVAPMTGKIVKVLVKPGDHVEPRQGLVVVEAMKMENELRSRAAGTVLEVRAAEGSLVEAGAILVVIE